MKDDRWIAYDIDMVPGNLPSSLKRISRMRILATAAVLVALLLVLFGRLIYLQVISYQTHATLSADNRIQIVPTAPVRGQIYDRNGTLLAANEPMFKLEIIPSQVENMKDLLSEISKLVPMSDELISNFIGSAGKYGAHKPYVLKEYLTEEQVARIAVERFRLRGAYVAAELRRRYVAGESVAHVVGSVGRIDAKDIKNIKTNNESTRYHGTQRIGKQGTELLAEDMLLGWPGREKIETNAHGRTVRILSQVLPTAGKDVYLTIDLDLQKAAFAALGENKGALVALDPRTGQVLAMVSKPAYDSNEFVNSSSRESILNLLRATDSPLFDRAVQGEYPPGSTIKPFLGLVANEEGLAAKKYNCPGWYQLPGRIRKHRCWRKSGHGLVNLRQAIERSCDVYFYYLAQELGINRMFAGLTRFGFGEETGVGLVNENAGLIPSPDWKNYVLKESWYDGETLITGIGQGYTGVTIMQLAHATSIIANRGKKYKPVIIQKFVDKNNGIVTEVKPELVEYIDFRQEYYKQIVDAMVDVVHGQRGTARSIANNLTYSMASKTGTVQIIRKKQDEEWDPEKVPKKFHPHGIFISFAPVENPRIVLAVVAENSGSGIVAAKIARIVLDHYLLKMPTDADGDQMADARM